MAGSTSRRSLRDRISTAAETALEETHVVSVVDVFVRVGWLAPSKVAAWRQGRLDYLVDAIRCSEGNLRAGLQFLHDWAEARKLDAIDAEDLSQSLEPRPLRFTPPEVPPNSKPRSARAGSRGV